MFYMRDVQEFFAKCEVFWAEVWVCAFGAPWAKPTAVVSNRPCILSLSRKCPGLSSTHTHIELQGKAPDGRNWTKVAGPYWHGFCVAWVKVWAHLEVPECGAAHLSGFGMFDTSSSLRDILNEKEFAPSGHRSTTVVSQRVAAALQPTRRALPSVLPEGLGPECHLELALRLVHPFQLAVPLPDYCKYAIKSLQAHPDIETFRAVSASLVEALSRACEPTNAFLLEQVDKLLLPILQRRNLALVREISWICQFPDPRFLIDYVLGMSTFGWADVAPNFVPRETSPEAPLDAAWKDIEAHNSFIMSRVQSSGDPELDEASWSKTKAEFEDGSLVGPFSSLEEVQRRWGKVRLLPRFPIWEQHGGAEQAKCRNIDNGLLGGQNAFTGSFFTNRPGDVDSFVGLVRAMMEAFPDQQLLGFTSDFKSAYRQCTASPEHAAFWVLTIWNPETQSQVFAVASAQLFGCSLAPLNFCRIPDWCAFVSSRLFLLAMLHCIDDLMSVEPLAISECGNKAWRTLARVCGWDIPDDKSPPPCAFFR